VSVALGVNVLATVIPLRRGARALGELT